jgi:glycosyltransferase involved in cell wall biosynthesis
MTSRPDKQDPMQWPARFKAVHGRPPRVLHICNIANYAWVNASLMRKHGADCVVLDPDFYHVASAPEWLEAALGGEHGDDFHPDWNKAGLSGFTRPEWFINGPAAFVIRELAAREQGAGLKRKVYRILSAIYRRAVAAERGKTSPFLRFVEAEGALAAALKTAIKRLTLGRAKKSKPPNSDAAGAPPVAQPSFAALPANFPAAITRQAMEPFDVIVGYTLGARYPAALGLTRFVSLELGTLRGLPFEDSPAGQLCAWLYRASPEVFITNVDCIAAADELGIPETRRTPIPHPFDLDRASAYANAPEPSPLAGPTPYFFCPARHHWRDGNASWLKGNDVLIQGAALAAAEGLRFRLVMVDWGEEVALSRQLIEDCGLAERVHWLRPQPRLKLWPIVCGAAAVLDQFAAAAFGGAGLEAMALGRRVVSRIEGAETVAFFDTVPPIMHAETPQQVARGIAAVLDDPQDEAGVGAAGQRWMAAEHGVERQLSLQFAAFERLTGDLARVANHAG